jgi:hypothetical protein
MIACMRVNNCVQVLKKMHFLNLYDLPTVFMGLKKATGTYLEKATGTTRN